MIVLTGADAAPAGLGPTAVTIGKFDGVHIGHQRVLARLRGVALERGLAPVAVTFDRNPLSLLRPEACPLPLVSNTQKLDLLADQGMAATLVLRFDRAFSEQSPEQFVDRVITHLDARVVLVGSDFRFGARGSGTVDTLRELGATRGFTVEVIDEVDGDAPGGPRRASSTWVRELLDAGDARAAADLLGREHRIRSIVVHGAKRGRELGYPTANLDPQLEGFVPRDGVYATRTIVDGVAYPSVTSVGNNPTFDGVPEKQVESHLFDVAIDLYDRPVEVAFVDYVRPMQRFDGIDSLVTQMHSDEARVRGLFGLAG
ncbi:bifunctional riboflavin kinase/FAD synthetase [Galbitalea sp. SE-J8]|uniref:bifunctional riboflavin kinase/FAD synthetase n=1 Tax=Galbitalea sp. SE-J8 TaxID=3054952 RepID=UPI00259CFBC3|nr:bifunctional riboflavin kinase/FAD synthetase [Galbitalea sp. SE-J8]MDM4762628.1 bifunctional riboflavin kinase/FAD synthetase [Galbitalea sp. SE-J8]